MNPQFTQPIKAVLGDIMIVGAAPMALALNIQYNTVDPTPLSVTVGLAVLGASAVVGALRLDKMWDDIQTYKRNETIVEPSGIGAILLRRQNSAECTVSNQPTSPSF